MQRVIVCTHTRQTLGSERILATMTRDRAIVLIAAALLVVAGTSMAGVVPAILGRVSTHWGEFTTVGFFLALLAAWAIGTLIFTPNRRHR